MWINHFGLLFRGMALIKVPIWRRIFVLSFHGNVERIVGYVTKVTMKNEDKKASKVTTLINATSLTIER